MPVLTRVAGASAATGDLATALPRLLYLADVPVECSYHGSALVYRLLQCYPVEKLLVVESNLLPSRPARRLPNVSYRELTAGWKRLRDTRFGTYYATWLSLTASRRATAVHRLLGRFAPDAVLSVTHGQGWQTAAEFAARHRLPLHLILHDDWPRVAGFPAYAAAWLDRTFGRVYRQAASRLCVSPFMRDDYITRYGVAGTVLYPSRAADSRQFDAPPERVARNDHPFTVAFGGTINSRGYVNALVNIATALATIGGRLLIFGPLTPGTARQVGLELPNIVLCGLMKSSELMSRLGKEADVLFIPMSFDSADAPNMKMGFPSKLADCTAIGLPLLIYGPAYCSAVRWARENPGVAEVVDTEDVERLRTAVERLTRNPEHRVALATQALEAGQRFFAHCAAWKIFQDALRGSLVKDAMEE